MLDLLLETAGLEIFHAYDGEAGIEAFRQHRPDVVLADIRMPLCDGIDMIQELQVIDPDVVTIVMSGYESPANLKRAIKVQAFEFLPKPYGAKRVTTVLGRALEERQRRRLISARPPSDADKERFDELNATLRARIAHFQGREQMLEQREQAVRDKERMIRDRQRFLRDSETKVEQRMNQMILKEAELEQLFEDINKARGTA